MAGFQAECGRGTGKRRPAGEGGGAGGWRAAYTKGKGKERTV